MFFNLTECPIGWVDRTDAEGRYLVGTPADGTVAATVETALTDAENRPVGVHDHPVTDAGHSPRDPAEDAAAVFSRRENPDRDRGPAGRGEHCLAVPPRRHRGEPLLPLGKEFLEAGKKRLLGDTQREASTSEVTDLRQENARLKELVAETVLENRLLKKSVTGSDSPEDEA